MGTVVRTALAGLGVAGALLVFAAPLGAQSREDRSADSFVVLTGRIVIVEGETFEDAVIFDGNVTSAGTVVSNVVAFNGDVTILGDVGENVVALNGKVTLEPGASVGGDEVSRETADIAEGATVGGEVTDEGFPTSVNLGEFAAFGRFAIWLASSISSLILGLLLLLFAPRAGEAVAAAASERFGQSVGIGFAVFFGLPIGAAIAFATLVGIPLSLGVLLALGLLYWLGYVASALVVGRLLVKPPTSRLLAFLAGWGILRAFAIVPVLGGVAWFLAAVFGLGALAVAARRTGREPPRSTALDATSAAPPMPMPPG